MILKKKTFHAEQCKESLPLHQGHVSQWVKILRSKLDSNGSFSSVEQINTKYNLSLDFLTFQQLKFAVEKYLTDLSLKTGNSFKHHRPI